MHLHVPGGKDVRGKAAHALFEIAEVVLCGWMAHTMSLMNPASRESALMRCRLRPGGALVRHSAEDGDLRKAGADAVVQIGARRARALDFGARHTRAMYPAAWAIAMAKRIPRNHARRQWRRHLNPQSLASKKACELIARTRTDTAGASVP